MIFIRDLDNNTKYAGKEIAEEILDEALIGSGRSKENT